MNNSGRVYFSLRGEFVPGELTEFLGLEPSRALQAGQRDPERGSPRCSLWDFSLDEDGAEPATETGLVDVYQMAARLIEVLRAHRQRIAAAVQKWNLAATLQVVLELSTDDSVSTPPIGFDPQVIEFLSAVGAGIDIDSYLVSGENED